MQVQSRINPWSVNNIWAWKHELTRDQSTICLEGLSQKFYNNMSTKFSVRTFITNCETIIWDNKNIKLKISDWNKIAFTLKGLISGLGILRHTYLIIVSRQRWLIELNYIVTLGYRWRAKPVNTWLSFIAQFCLYQDARACVSYCHLKHPDVLLTWKYQLSARGFILLITTDFSLTVSFLCISIYAFATLYWKEIVTITK